IILISGCQDHEFSYDYGTNGLFTSKVKETWNTGNFNGTHNRFHSDVAQKVTSNQADQNPNFMTLGKNISVFSQNKPFIVNAPGWPITVISGGTDTSTAGSNTGVTSGTTTTNQQPSVNAPASWNINDGQPVIDIIKGSNNYYYIEIVNNEQLFDYTYWSDNGNAQNSFFSWNDSSVSNRLTSEQFTIPVHAWNQLKNSEGLYIRVGTTSSSNETEWENHMVSESAMSGSGQHAPFMHLIGTTVEVESGPVPNTNITGPHDGDVESEGYSQISDSVGYQGENKYNDVLLVQAKLNLVPISEGGPTTPLVEDGLYGSKTRNAITRFQREQNLTSSGKIEPGDSTFILLVLKSGSVRIYA
ncbi:MAG: peptidoglycan-binding protein, partial [Arenibacter sp.]|nr:peptidoglycan-binding protein [Arenibacter sp.]